MGDYGDPAEPSRVLGTEHSSISVSIRSPAVDTLPVPSLSPPPTSSGYAL